MKNLVRVKIEAERLADGTYTWVAKNGVRVYSVAAPRNAWEDIPLLHAVWSYHSWISTIVRSYGYEFAWMEWWKRPAYKVTYKELEAQIAAEEVAS